MGGLRPWPERITSASQLRTVAQPLLQQLSCFAVSIASIACPVRSLRARRSRLQPFGPFNGGRHRRFDPLSARGRASMVCQVTRGRRLARILARVRQPREASFDRRLRPSQRAQAPPVFGTTWPAEVEVVPIGPRRFSWHNPSGRVTRPTTERSQDPPPTPSRADDTENATTDYEIKCYLETRRPDPGIGADRIGGSAQRPRAWRIMEDFPAIAPTVSASFSVRTNGSLLAL